MYARLEAGRDRPLREVVAQISRVLAARLAPDHDATLAPFAADVVALDESTLDQVARTLPALRGRRRATGGGCPAS